MRLIKVLCLGVGFVSLSAWGAWGPKPTSGICTVDVFGAQPVQGGRCKYFDQVMVGIQSQDPLTILCGRLRVNCNSPTAPASSDSPRGADEIVVSESP